MTDAVQKDSEGRIIALSEEEGRVYRAAGLPYVVESQEPVVVAEAPPVAPPVDFNALLGSEALKTSNLIMDRAARRAADATARQSEDDARRRAAESVALKAAQPEPETQPNPALAVLLFDLDQSLDMPGRSAADAVAKSNARTAAERALIGYGWSKAQVDTHVEAWHVARRNR